MAANTFVCEVHFSCIQGIFLVRFALNSLWWTSNFHTFKNVHSLLLHQLTHLRPGPVWEVRVWLHHVCTDEFCGRTCSGMINEKIILIIPPLIQVWWNTVSSKKCSFKPWASKKITLFLYRNFLTFILCVYPSPFISKM